MSSLGKRNECQLLTIVVGAPQTLGAAQHSIPYPSTIAAVPGIGGTLLVEYQVADGGAWTAWPSGTVSSKTIDVLDGPVFALRFTAAVANATVEIAQ